MDRFYTIPQMHGRQFFILKRTEKTRAYKNMIRDWHMNLVTL